MKTMYTLVTVLGIAVYGVSAHYYGMPAVAANPLPSAFHGVEVCTANDDVSKSVLKTPSI